MTVNSHPVVVIPCDVKQVGIHPFHAVGEKYINAVAHGSGCLPWLLPAIGEGRDLRSLHDHFDPATLLAGVDGVFLPGSSSNVAPGHYGETLAFAEQDLDAQRDALTLDLIRAAVAQGVPLFAVCRGFQEMNVAFGGALHQRVHEQQSLRDHRADTSQPREVQYAPAHDVSLVEGGLLAQLTGCETLAVNSIHEQGVARLAEGLSVEARSPDGLIEAFRVSDAPAFALGVQWHPEWRYHEDAASRALFAAFGEAARARAAVRGRASAAPVAELA